MDDRNFGRDDGVKCDKCGGKTFLSYDQGGGLVSYDCETSGCDEVTTVQYESDGEEEEPDPSDYFDEVWEDVL